MWKKPSDQLVWRPTAALCLSLMFLCFCGVSWSSLFFDPRQEALHEYLWVFATYAALTGPTMGGTIYGLRTRVECGKTGLRWRDWRGVWRAVGWDEIHDFFKRSDNKNVTYCVKTESGNFTFDLQGDGQRIAETIAVRAGQTPTRVWEVRGERECDPWPRRFEFCPAGRNHTLTGALTGLLAALVWVAWLLFRLPPREETGLGVWMLAYIGPILLVPILPLVIWLFVWLRAREARRIRGQSVEISPLGITFQGAKPVHASWSQIEAWRWMRRSRTRFLQIQTADGEVEIPIFIAGFGAVCRILERFSGAALVKVGEEFAMPGGEVRAEPDGTLSFNFYDLNARMMVGLLTLMGILMTVLPSILHFADPDSPLRNPTPGIIGIPMLLGSLLLHWTFKNARLCLSEQTLEWCVPFGARSVAWKNIESFGSMPATLGWIRVGGKKVNLSYLWASIAPRSRLHMEIEQRAFNAQGRWL